MGWGGCAGGHNKETPFPQKARWEAEDASRRKILALFARTNQPRGENPRGDGAISPVQPRIWIPRTCIWIQEHGFGVVLIDHFENSFGQANFRGIVQAMPHK